MPASTRPEAEGAVAVLGGGSFGTALAHHLAGRGQAVSLWMRRPTQAAAVSRDRRNPDYLSEFALHPGIQATSDLAAAVGACRWVVVAVPCRAMRPTLTQLAPLLHGQPLVLCAKGLEEASLMTMHEVALDVLGPGASDRLVALSGPSFAAEIMQGHPTAVVLASRPLALGARLAPRFFSAAFRAYCTADVTGVEMGGALKNVIAIAAGAAAGMGLGENTRAALLTRGLAEMTRLAVAKGGHPLTLQGLAGVGDLLLTCTGGRSRNRALGCAVGAGQGVAAALEEVQQLAEGVRTTAAAHALAQRLAVDAPITAAVHSVLFEGVSAQQARARLTRREPGLEGR